MAALVKLVQPIIYGAINSRQVKELVVHLLERYAKTTDNDIDDMIVRVVKDALLK